MHSPSVVVDPVRKAGWCDRKMEALISPHGHCHPGHAHCATEWVNAWRIKGGSREDSEKEFLSASRHMQLAGGIKITELHVTFKNT